MHSPYIQKVPALNRRTFLKGVGVSLALPFLESMIPSFAWARDVAAPLPPRRFVGIMTNMGILPQFFFPEREGRDYAATPYLEFLKEHREHFSVFSGVTLPGVDGGHASESSFLTGAPGAGSGSFKNSVSLDQVMAEQLGAHTRFPSLALSVGSGKPSLSYTRSGSMIPPERSPLRLYEQLFIEGTAESKAAAARRLKEDRSLLDQLREQAKALGQTVGAADRDRLDQYFTSVRDLEHRLAKSEEWIGRPKAKTTAKPPEDLKDDTDLAKNERVMFDLVRLALESDSTRIITIFLSTGGNIKLPGVRTQCHELTHHGGRDEKISELRLIEEAQFAALAELLTGLRASQEQGASLLDSTACLYGTNMGSANAHSTDNLPVLLAGGGFKHGQHLAFDRKKNYPLSNLYVSLLQRLGIETNEFSTGKGTMKGLELI